MEQKDIEYFRTLLNNMLEEAQHKGDSTLEDLTDSNELFADPADRRPPNRIALSHCASVTANAA